MGTCHQTGLLAIRTFKYGSGIRKFTRLCLSVHFFLTVTSPNNIHSVWIWPSLSPIISTSRLHFNPKTRETFPIGQLPPVIIKVTIYQYHLPQIACFPGEALKAVFSQKRVYSQSVKKIILTFVGSIPESNVDVNKQQKQTPPSYAKTAMKPLRQEKASHCLAKIQGKITKIVYW